MQLVRRHALFGRRHKVDRGNPFREREFGTVHDRSDRDGELFPALRFAALVEAGAVRLALEALDLRLVGVAAVGADRAVRPALVFQPLAGGV